MVAVPIGKNTLKRLAGLVPTLDLLNVYAEVTESNPTTGYDLLTRPVLANSSIVAGGPGRGIFSHDTTYGTLGGIYAGVGGGFYKSGGGGGFSTLGALSGPAGTIQVAFGDTSLLVASGGALQTTDGSAPLSNVAFPDDQDVFSVAYLNGYFLAVPVGAVAEDGARYIYFSDPTLNVGDTGFFTGDRRVGAVMTGGPILRIEARGPELHVFKTDGVEVFQPTGLDDLDDPPFQRVSGREYNRGTYQPYSITNIAETLAYVDSESKVCLVAEQPVTISTPSVSERIANAVRTGAQLLGWSFSWNTHDFYVLALGATTSLVCDISLTPPAWYEWTDADGSSWRGAFGVTASDGTTYVADQTTGNVWTITEAAPVDYGAATMRQRGTGILALPSRQMISSVSLDCAVGLGGAPQPQVELFTSVDQGQTYDSNGVESLGAAGATLERVRWTRLGQFEPPMVMIAFESDNPVRWRFSNMRANEGF